MVDPDRKDINPHLIEVKMPHLYKNVEGWFNWEDLYIEAVKNASDGSKFVEIGSWSGKSATFLAEMIKESGKKIQLFCVDPYSYGLHGADAWTEIEFPRLIKFRKSIVQNGFEDIVFNILSKSKNASSIFMDGSLDMVYIDGDHTQQGCTDDIIAYLPKLRPDGVLAGHDYTDEWDGVMKAVNSVFYPADFKVICKDTWVLNKSALPRYQTWHTLGGI